MFARFTGPWPRALFPGARPWCRRFGGVPRGPAGLESAGSVIRDNGAEGQPSGWPSRAIRTVDCGSHPQGRSESEDPRSGLTAAGNRARGTRSRALLNGGESFFGCHFHPPPRPPERSRSGPRSVTLIGPEVKTRGASQPGHDTLAAAGSARRGLGRARHGMGPDRQRGRDAAVMVRDGTLAGPSVEFRARPFEPRPALGDPCKGRGGGGEGVQGVQPSGREGPSGEAGLVMAGGFSSSLSGRCSTGCDLLGFGLVLAFGVAGAFSELVLR